MQQQAPRRPANRTLQICLVAILLLTSGISSAFASQSTPSATPSNDGDTQLYIGHGAQLTAEIPSRWRPDFSLEYNYAGREGFISSKPLMAWMGTIDSLETACESVAENDPFAENAAVELTTWRELPTCIVRTTADTERDPVSLVFRHPDPADDGHNTYVAVTVDAAHFDQIVATISFDPARVTPATYLDSAIDFIRTHSLQRNAIDWDEVRNEAHSIATNLVANHHYLGVYPAISYVIDQIRSVGGDAHNRFEPPQVATSRSSYLPPQGRALSHDIGYVSIPGFLGDEVEADRFASEIQAILVSQAGHGACGWIVDLRGNTGGNMYPMLLGLAPLLPPGDLIGFRDVNGLAFQVTLMADGTLAYHGGPHDNTLATWEAPDVVTTEAGLDEQPVAVLIGPRNGSSGEATALAFAGRDQTGYFGEPTFGVATAPAYLYLFDGALLSIAASWMTGPHGAIYPEGILPDVTISPIAVVGPLADDPVVQTASDWLEQQPGCEDRSATPVATPTGAP